MIQEKLEEEEMFRVQVAIPEAKREHRSKKKTTQPIKIKAGKLLIFEPELLVSHRSKV